MLEYTTTDLEKMVFIKETISKEYSLDEWITFIETQDKEVHNIEISERFNNRDIILKHYPNFETIQMKYKTYNNDNKTLVYKVDITVNELPKLYKKAQPNILDTNFYPTLDMSSQKENTNSEK